MPWCLYLFFALLALPFAQATFCLYLMIKYRHRYDVANRWFIMYRKRNWSFKISLVLYWPIDLLIITIIIVIMHLLGIIAILLCRDPAYTEEVRQALSELVKVSKKRLFG